jgi:hypothetical protein
MMEVSNNLIKICPSVTFSTTNPIWTALELNQCLQNVAMKKNLCEIELIFNKQKQGNDIEAWNEAPKFGQVRSLGGQLFETVFRFSEPRSYTRNDCKIRVLVRFTRPLLMQRTATVTLRSRGSFHHVCLHLKCVKANHPLTKIGSGAADTVGPANKENKQVKIHWLIVGFFNDLVSTAQSI